METAQVDLSEEELGFLLSLELDDAAKRCAEASALLDNAVRRSLPTPVTGLGGVRCSPAAKSLLQRAQAVDIGTDNRRCDISYLFIQSLFTQLVREPTAGTFPERCGDFALWITNEGCPPDVACDVIGGMDIRWRGATEVRWNPISLADPDDLVALGNALGELSLARASHQFARILQILDGLTTDIEPARARLEGYRLFARLGGGFDPLSPRIINSVLGVLNQPLFRGNCNARFLVVNGLFLAPPTEQLSPKETGEVIERCLTGFVLTAFYGQPWDPWDPDQRSIPNPTEIQNLWGGNSPVVGYFYARAFRLQGSYDLAMDCADYAFMGLGSDGFAATLMNQIEREREAIRLSREFGELAGKAENAEESVSKVVDGLRGENAQLIATFTGFFAFVFGALALFFREQQILTAGRGPGEVILLNLAVLAPAGFILALLILLARWVFAPRRDKVKEHQKRRRKPRRQRS